LPRTAFTAPGRIDKTWAFDAGGTPLKLKVHTTPLYPPGEVPLYANAVNLVVREDGLEGVWTIRPVYPACDDPAVPARMALYSCKDANRVCQYKIAGRIMIPCSDIARWSAAALGLP
jgi:hypothetical protein